DAVTGDENGGEQQPIVDLLAAQRRRGPHRRRVRIRDGRLRLVLVLDRRLVLVRLLSGFQHFVGFTGGRLGVLRRRWRLGAARILVLPRSGGDRRNSRFLHRRL